MRAKWLLVLLAFAAPATAQSVKTGIEAWSRTDYAAALAAWRPLAEKGNADAMFNLGQAYRLGRGVPIDLAQAQDWYDRAAHAGHVDAQTQLGMLLFQTGNRPAGLRWLKTAADKGEARAQLLYGTALFNGDGIARDPLAAYRYIAKSAAQGLAPARTTLEQLDDAMPADMRQQALAGGVTTAAPPAAKRPVKEAVKPPALPPVAPPVKRPPQMAAKQPASPPTPPVKAGGAWRVQLGAFSQPGAATALFRKFAGGPLAGRQPFLVAAGAVTRLQAGPFASRADAAAACTALAARGQACFVAAAAR